MFHHIFAIAESLVKAKSFLAVFFAFTSGFLLSLTPCFLSLVPVMLGMLGFSAGRDKKETLFYLLFFVLGLSTVYTLLGLISGIMGVMFGKISEHYLTQIVVGNIFLFFALVLWGVFNLPFLDIKTKKHLSRGGAFVLGGAGALSAGGCTFPVLGSILVLAALQHDFVFRGVLLSFFIKENLLVWLIPGSYRR